MIFDEVDMTATVLVTDVNEQPTGLDVDLHSDLVVENGNATLREDTDTSSRIRIADLVVTDPDTSPAFQATAFSLEGDDAALFEIEDGVLYLRAGVTLDHETQPELNISIKYAGIGAEGDPPAAKDITVIITDYDEPAVLNPGFETAYVDENVAAGIVLTTVSASDPEGGRVYYFLDRNAENSDMFRIHPSTGVLTLRPGHVLDYETQDSVEVTVLLRASADGNRSHREPVTITLHINNVIETDTIEIIQLADAHSGAVIGKVTLAGANAVTATGSSVVSGDFIIEYGLLKIGSSDVEAGLYHLTLSNPDGSSQDVTIRVNDIRRDVEIEGSTNSSKAFETGFPEDVVDADGDKLAFEDTTAPVATATGSYTVENGVLIWTPVEGIVREIYAEVFEVDIHDFTGGRSKATVTLTVMPTIAVSGVMEAWEDSVWNDRAGHLISDDARDIHTLTLTVNDTVVGQDQTVITAQYGTLTVDMNGYWAYTLDNNNAAVEALDGDDDDTDGAVGMLIETITVVYTNAGGETETLSFDITIHGRTDVYFTDDGQSSNPGVHEAVSFSGPFIRYIAPHTLFDDDTSVHGDKVEAEFRAYTRYGSDVMHGNSEDNDIYSRSGSNVMYGYGGDDRLGSGGGSDIIYGGEGHDISMYQSRYMSDVEVDLGSETRWKYNRATGEWESGTGDEYEFIRASYLREYDDPDGDGTVSVREYDYLNSIEGVSTSLNGFARGVVSENRFYGNDEANSFKSRDGNHIIDSRGGDDLILSGSGVDILAGGSGRDIIAGGEGVDTFVLYQESDVVGGRDLDIVLDFTLGDDLIRLEAVLDDTPTLEELQASANIRWEQRHVETDTQYNDNAALDTVIYSTEGTLQTGDDIMLMVLEDFTDELTLAQFDIV